MKILSKHKDYYDYLVGTYGYDPTVTYDRRILPLIKFDGSITEKDTDPVQKFMFYICGRRLTIFEYKGVLYHTKEQIEKLNKLLVKNKLKKYSIFLPYTYRKHSYGKKHNVPSDVNLKLRQPIVFDLNGNEDYYVPFLSTYNFHHIYDADTMYRKVYEFMSWLNDNPPAPDNQTNDGKIVSHGFHRKTSFRPKMK